MYEYRILEILKVVDGDTLDARVALGFGLNAALRFRLAHVDTPEVYGVNASSAGADAKAYTQTWVDERRGRLFIRTYKGAQGALGIGDGAFGRWLGDVYDDRGDSLSRALVEAFHVSLIQVA